MSEGEPLGPPYVSGGFPDRPPEPEKSSSGLPPFSSFSAAELAEGGLGSRLGPEGFGTEYGRIIDFPGWSYYDEGLSGRLLERGDGLPMLIPQTQYRPWESKEDGVKYEYPGSPKLPSFQSQFNAFPEQNGDTMTLTTLTPAPPSPPNLPSFHTLSTVTVNPRYPLVPAPVQAREIPTIQQQFLDERHIHLFQSPTTINNQYHQLGLSNPGIIQGNFVQAPQQATLLTVVKTEPVAIVTAQLHQQPHIYQNSIIEHHDNLKDENSSSPRLAPDSRKKERRKIRASSMDSESDVGSSENSGQVAAISSTAGFKSPMMHQGISMAANTAGSQGSSEECENGSSEKQTKKKRKRCGECIGCQRKENCGDCAPCRNDKSHQICKMRRCEKLTDKKHLLYLTNEFPRTESRRGRGKGTRANYRNKGGRGGSSNQSQGPATPQQNQSSSGTATPQPTTIAQPASVIGTLNGSESSPGPVMMTTDQTSGSVMPFYGTNIPPGTVPESVPPGFVPGTVREHRFPNAVWQQTSIPGDPSAIGAWSQGQGQYIHLPPQQIDELRYHAQYPTGSPVTVASYTQPSPAGYQPQGTFLHNNGSPYPTSQPPAVSPLLNGSNSTRSSSVNGTIEYLDSSPRPTEYINGSYAGQEPSIVPQPSSTPNSRCSSVQNVDSGTDSGSGMAPAKTPTTVNSYSQAQLTNPGNAMPGYPPQQPPQSQQSLHNSSGYPGQNTQSAQRRFLGEDIKQSYHSNNAKEENAAVKDWISNDNKETLSNWNPVSMSDDKTMFGDHRIFRPDGNNVNNKLKTMIINKQTSPTYQQNFQDNQYMHSQQFSQTTPPPVSPISPARSQPHQIPMSPSHGTQSSHHFQFNNRPLPMQQMQAQKPMHLPQSPKQVAQKPQPSPSHHPQHSPTLQSQTQPVKESDQHKQKVHQQVQTYQQQYTQHIQQQQLEQQKLHQQHLEQQKMKHHIEQQKMQQIQQHRIEQHQNIQQQSMHLNIDQQKMQHHHHMEQQKLHQQLEHQQMQQHLEQQKIQQHIEQQKHQQQIEQQKQQQQMEQQKHHQQIEQQKHHQQMEQQKHHQQMEHQKHQQMEQQKHHQQMEQQKMHQQIEQQKHHQQMEQQKHQQQIEQHQMQQFSQQRLPQSHVKSHQNAQQQQLIECQKLQQQALEHHQIQQQHLEQQQLQHQHLEQQRIEQNMQQQHLEQQKIQQQHLEHQKIQHQHLEQQKIQQQHLEQQHIQQQHLGQKLQQHQQREQQKMQQQLDQRMQHHLEQQNMQQHQNLEQQDILQLEPKARQNEQLQQQQIEQQKHMNQQNVHQQHPEQNHQQEIKFQPHEQKIVMDRKFQPHQLDQYPQPYYYENQKRTEKSSPPKVEYPPGQKPYTNPIKGSNFLAQGHHLQNLATEDGGVWDISPNKSGSLSAMENFIKYAASVDEQTRGYSSELKNTVYSPIVRQPETLQLCSSVSTQTGTELDKCEEKIPKSYYESISSNFVKQEKKPNQDYNWPCRKEAINNQIIRETLRETIWLNHRILVEDRRPRCFENLPKTPKLPFGYDPRLRAFEYAFKGEGGPMILNNISGAWCCRRGGTDKPTIEHMKDGCCQGLQTLDEILEEEEDETNLDTKKEPKEEKFVHESPTKETQENMEKMKTTIKTEGPDCNCFPMDKFPPEPGSYYTHLGAAASLVNLRNDLENRTGHKGCAIRFEKILYTGKEGKTTQGCPLAKWVIRRASLDEKVLVVVKHRTGHQCATAWIVVAMVAWEGVPSMEADYIYNMLVHKLNKFGLPTVRRCATNEPRTCACQGLDPDTCGASFSFGCSWSMYYNGCKYARSKTVRKFRLSVRSEEQEVEERLHTLATIISPLYQKLAPSSFNNMTQYEKDGSDCRLGFQPGRPWSGVTACVDFCAHSHRDMHNMNNGCTTVVTLTKHRSLSKPDDEQLHVLPLYTIDDTDEFGAREGQLNKVKSGAVEILTKFPCEVRVRSVPLQPCRRHGKKRKDEEETCAKKETGNERYCRPPSAMSNSSMGFEGIDPQVQIPQVSSTVLDSPYHGWGYVQNQNHSTVDGLNPANVSKSNWQQSPVSQPNYSSSSWPSHIPSSTPNGISWPGEDDADSTTINARKRSTLANNGCQTQWPQDQRSPWPEEASDSFARPQPPKWKDGRDAEKVDQGRRSWPEEKYGTTSCPLPYGYSPQGSPFYAQPYGLPSPFDRSTDSGYCTPPQSPLTNYQIPRWDLSNVPPPLFPAVPEPAKSEPIGEVVDYVNNEDCFKDSQMGGVAIALSHGSVLFECAKHELHATTALRRPNRRHPNRISLVFYQHRNLNKPKHGWDEWEEKLRLKKLGIVASTPPAPTQPVQSVSNATQFMLHTNTFPTITWTTLFPMHPCIISGPYQDKPKGLVR